jgi:hypothetical protein
VGLIRYSAFASYLDDDEADFDGALVRPLGSEL